jgi:hypothetical protein
MLGLRRAAVRKFVLAGCSGGGKEKAPRSGLIGEVSDPHISLYVLPSRGCCRDLVKPGRRKLRGARRGSRALWSCAQPYHYYDPVVARRRPDGTTTADALLGRSLGNQRTRNSLQNWNAAWNEQPDAMRLSLS